MKKFYKKKSFMSTWEDLDSSSSNFDKDQTHIDLMANTPYSTTSNDSNEDVDFFYMHFITQI